MRPSTWLTPWQLYRTLVSSVGNFGGSPVIYTGELPGERLENNLQFPVHIHTNAHMRAFSLSLPFFFTLPLSPLSLFRGENDQRRGNIRS